MPTADQRDDDGDGVGDACDTHYCVVIDPTHPEDCLDPKASFKVSGGGSLTLKKGEKVRLPLFANRNGAAIEYTWTVLSRPGGSRAAVEHPNGAVTMSRHWQYAYVDGSVPTFTADVDGDYDLQVHAKLAFPDRVYPDRVESTSGLKLNVGVTGGAFNCASLPAGPMAGAGAGRARRSSAGAAGGRRSPMGSPPVPSRRWASCSPPRCSPPARTRTWSPSPSSPPTWTTGSRSRAPSARRPRTPAASR